MPEYFLLIEPESYCEECGGCEYAFIDINADGDAAAQTQATIEIKRHLRRISTATLIAGRSIDISSVVADKQAAEAALQNKLNEANELAELKRLKAKFEGGTNA